MEKEKVNDKCEHCGSIRWQYHSARRVSNVEPGCNEYLECLECGATKPYDEDYDYYREDYE